jgi:thymidine kinase
MSAFEYRRNNKNVILLKPSIDTRSSNKIISRIGLSEKVDIIIHQDTLFENEELIKNINNNPVFLFIDEVQFLTTSQIEQLRALGDRPNITIFCYGLRTDFQGKLFTGTTRLFELADDITYISNISLCKFCSRQAIINARYYIKNNKIIIVKDGPVIDIGAEEKYVNLCWNCWNNENILSFHL